MRRLPFILTVFSMLAAASSSGHAAPTLETGDGCAAPAQSRPGDEAVEVFRCGFEDDVDLNYDGWPDGWSRRTGKDYPRYIKIARSQEPSPEGDACLRIDLDGAAAIAYSPPIDVSAKYTYLLSTWLKTEELVGDEAYLCVTFYDSEQKPLESYYSSRHTRLPAWRRVEVGPIMPRHESVRQAVVSLHLKPKDPGEADLVGAALLDDVWLGRLPRMTLATNSDHNVYFEPGQVEVTCEVSGVIEPNPLVHFQLYDASAGKTACVARQVRGQRIRRGEGAAKAAGPQREETFPGEPPAEDGPVPEGFAGKVSWRPPIDDYGFYRVTAVMTGAGGVSQRQEITLAVLRNQRPSSSGEFGWSLPGGDRPLPMPTLIGLLTQAGINWVKFPVWYSQKEPDRADRIAWFAERLQRHGIEMVGVLAEPPEDVAHLFNDSAGFPAAGVFAEPELWCPALNPVMTRLSLKVRWWQVGSDTDDSWVGYPYLAEKIREIKDQLQRFGQEIHLGIGWRWLDETPVADDPPWGFLLYRANPPLTRQEMDVYLRELDRDAAPAGPQSPQTWCLLQPLAKGAYPLEDRARDLVGRMLAAKMHRADCIFASDPFDAETGLMNPDGSPGELLIPWRTTAMMLSGAEFLGSIRMPGGSNNFIFTRGGKAVMVVWNEQPTREALFLGDEVEQVDVWGRGVTPGRQEHRQVIEVGPLPTFLTGVHPQIARCRMSFQFDQEKIPSVFDRAQRLGFGMRNDFDSGVSGEITLRTPEVWDTDPPSKRFRLASGETLADYVRVTLLPKASCGPQPIRVDFELAADRAYKFSVWREVAVGLGDVTVELTARLTDDDQLIVEQSLENHTDQFVSFDCQLFAYERRRLRHQVLDLPRGRSSRTYTLENGSELLGKPLWLRAQEIGGNRVLSYTITPER